MEALSASRQLATLPIPRTHLVGREAECVTARALLLDEAVPLLTLTGPGGVGKTRLALAVAHSLSAKFVDGAVFVDLSALATGDLVAAAVAAALSIPSPDTSLSDAISAFLRPQHYLLVLDNCEHVLPEAAALTSTLLAACPTLQILATSRAALRVRGEQVFPVPILATPSPGTTDLEAIQTAPAVVLYAQRARAADSQFSVNAHNAESVAAICRHLDGLPLALELAAARAALLTPAAMADLLRQRFPVPLAGTRDAPLRQQTMRDTIAWSYGLLPPVVQTTFRHLAIFAGGWTLEAASAVLTLPMDVALDHLATLVDHNLVTRQTGTGKRHLRFSMLETIRGFGLEPGNGALQTEAARNRHATYFRELAESLNLFFAFPGDPSWIAEVAPDEDNFRLALERFRTQGDTRSLSELSSAFSTYWLTRSLFREGRQWLELAISDDDDLPAALRSRTRQAAGIFINYHGEADAAAPILEDAVALARECGDSALLRDALQDLGLSRLLQADYTRALVLFEESERIARGISPGEPNAERFLGAAIYLQGLAAQRSGNDAAAMERFLAALPCLQAHGSNRRAGMVLGEIGIIHLRAGSVHAAATALIEGVARIWTVRDDMALTRYLRGLAIIATMMQQPAAAAQLLGAAGALDARTPYAAVARARDDELVRQCFARLQESATPDTVDRDQRAGAGFSTPKIVACARLVAVGAIGESCVNAIWQNVQAPDPGPAVTDNSPDPISSAPSSREQFDLTRRETEVLSLLGQRLTNAEIAEQLFVGQSTVATHITNLMGKLGAANRREAATIAIRHGLI